MLGTIGTKVPVLFGHGLWKIRPACDRTQGYAKATYTSNPGSMDGRGSFEVNLFPFARNDALANLLGSLALLVHGIRVVELFKTSGALGTVCIFEAAVQTVMPHTVAIAVARLLVEDHGDL